VTVRQGPCDDVKQGYVADPAEDFIMIQNYVDRGGNPWRLNPLETAKRVGIEVLGFNAGDTFKFRSYFYEWESGLWHALVWAKHGPCLFQVELLQPVKQGRGGVWAVHRVILSENTETVQS
jgi:hypothetical protein